MTEKKYDSSKVIVGIPAFNTAKNIAEIIHNAKKYSDNIVVCDDGSVDGTSKIAERAGAFVIKHEKNKGYGAALKSLFEYAKQKNPQVFVTMDSDGQHNVEDIPKIIQPIIDGEVDLVTGSRYLNQKGIKEIKFKDCRRIDT